MRYRFQYEDEEFWIDLEPGQWIELPVHWNPGKISIRKEGDVSEERDNHDARDWMHWANRENRYAAPSPFGGLEWGIWREEDGSISIEWKGPGEGNVTPDATLTLEPREVRAIFAEELRPLSADEMAHAMRPLTSYHGRPPR